MAPAVQTQQQGAEADGSREVFYDWALKTYAELDTAIAEIKHLRGARTGHVIVACKEGVGKYVLPAVISDVAVSIGMSACEVD